MTTNLIFLLAAHPHVLKAAQIEIDEAIRSHGLSTTSPKYEDCKDLSFVDACVREGLRIVASTFPRRRSSPPGIPFDLAGKMVPPGTSVSASACEIGRHKDLYGDDADDFNPDRWLQASEERLRLWETLDVHWGFGVRKCLGKHIGSMILYKSIVMVCSTIFLNPLHPMLTCTSFYIILISNWRRIHVSVSGATPHQPSFGLCREISKAILGFNLRLE